MDSVSSWTPVPQTEHCVRALCHLAVGSERELVGGSLQEAGGGLSLLMFPLGMECTVSSRTGDELPLLFLLHSFVVRFK